jgi:hypothetical protein
LHSGVKRIKYGVSSAVWIAKNDFRIRDIIVPLAESDVFRHKNCRYCLIPNRCDVKKDERR